MRGERLPLTAARKRCTTVEGAAARLLAGYAFAGTDAAQPPRLDCDGTYSRLRLTKQWHLAATQHARSPTDIIRIVRTQKTPQHRCVAHAHCTKGEPAARHASRPALHGTRRDAWLVFRIPLTRLTHRRISGHGISRHCGRRAELPLTRHLIHADAAAWSAGSRKADEEYLPATSERDGSQIGNRLRGAR
jgi:hypothetical protein